VKGPVGMALSQSLFTLQVGFIGFVVGLVFWRFPPKKINSVYGYRTPRSQKDIASWRFAQRFSAKLMVWTGLANMGICRVCDSVLCRMDLPGAVRTIYEALLVGISAIALCVSVVLPTEIALARRQKL